jgi:patatin-like phospholipase/acyl hydrolase
MVQADNLIAMRRILSIDGGGIKGVFPAAFLAEVEEVADRPLADYFDLIVGTSTGGIIALGLGLGFTAKEMLAFYETRGPEIFRGNRAWRSLRQLRYARYDRQPLERALQDAFGERRLGESTKRLVVPALNLETGEVHVYKTSHHERFVMDYKVPVVEVALATAAAPTYFPTYRSAAGVPLVDGGVWANNPVGAAVVEALGVLGWSADELRVLSLGCTTEPLQAKPHEARRLGLGYWLPKLVSVFMAGQSSASLGTAQLLAGHDHVVRISPVVPNRRFRLDAPRDIESLRGLGASEARKAWPSLQRVFLGEPAAPFVPHHTAGPAHQGDQES